MAKKSEIRSKAKAALDALLAASSEQDEQRAEAHLSTALTRLSEAAGVPCNPKQTDEGAEQNESLREALAYAAGETDRPRTSGDLLDRLFGRDAWLYREGRL